MEKAIDYCAAARQGHRELFVVAHPYPFLVGLNAIGQPTRGRTTEERPPVDFDGALTTRVTLPRMQEPVCQVFAVKKIQPAFESMITVGRSPNNDIVLADRQVSKFHAYFRQTEDGIQLFDASSRNGTFVGEVRLTPKGPGVRVRVGDRVRFAAFEYEFLDAGAGFDRIRAHADSDELP